ncbi:MAG: Glu/Leu/Phe/Val dehydrogenase, partial [Candidatus Atribacteria bacterium]|nr:Glu/Leu/Phe/Val dehydrogenase [Candidatus Atribacteria bacterium]
KTSLAELPYGGAKGGIRFNPKEKTPAEIEKISRAYINGFYKVLGEDIDIPAPDVYTNSQIMAWMLDEFEKKMNRHEPGMITGKPLELQGCAIRATATAKGGAIIIQEMVKQLMTGKKGAKVAIQGFGNAGANLAEMLFKLGFKIVAVSDSQGGVYDQNGLDIDRIKEIKKQTGLINGDIKGGRKINNREILELPVDILILAALENQITEENVSQIKANYIVEIANGPINYQADQQLFEKGIVVIPDILANAG